MSNNCDPAFIVVQDAPEVILLEVTTIEQIVIEAPGPQGPPGADAFPPELGLFLMWSQLHPSFFLTYTYASGILTNIDMWTDNTATTKIFNKHFNYTLGVLASIVITRISDSAIETKTFTFSSGILISQNVVQT